MMSLLEEAAKEIEPEITKTCEGIINIYEIEVDP